MMWKQTLRITVFLLGLIVLMFFAWVVQNRVRKDSRIKKLKLIENQIKVIEYDIKCKGFFGDPDDNLQQMQPTGFYSMSHLIVDHQTGCLYMKREGIDKCDGGQLLATKYEFSFDGTKSVELDYSSDKTNGGADGKIKGLIYNEPLLSSDSFSFHNTGLTIFPGFFERRGILNTITNAKEFKIVKKTNGILEIHYFLEEVLRPKKTFYQWEKVVLDMKRGGIITDIIGYDLCGTDPNEYPFDKITVEYLLSGNGIWLPKSMTEIRGAYGPRSVYKYSFDNVMINHIKPDTEKNCFRIDFPKDTYVLDRRSMKSYRVGNNGFKPINFSFTFNKKLIGQLTPELEGVKGWKNGNPITLSGLRGKVVLLYFWGYWCGPCVMGMPKLIDLHNAFEHQGLVIIAIHDPSVDSVSKLDEKLRKNSAKFWGGRDLPFLVALDGGELTAAYGIKAFPTALLINQKGELLGDFDYKDETNWIKLEKLLNIERK